MLLLLGYSQHPINETITFKDLLYSQRQIITLGNWVRAALGRTVIQSTLRMMIRCSLYVRCNSLTTARKYVA